MLMNIDVIKFSLRRNEVGGLLSPEVAEKLEKLRRGH